MTILEQPRSFALSPSASQAGRSLAATALVVVLAGGMLAACAEDPQYLTRDQVLEVGAPGGDPALAMDQLLLPIRLETPEEAMERAEIEAVAGFPIPFVSLDDLSISIEWTLKNLADTEGTVRIHVNGGNEQFYYVPELLLIDPEEDEEAPALMGDIPIVVPGNGSVSGVFREDQVREAAIDLRLFTGQLAGTANPDDCEDLRRVVSAILEQHDLDSMLANQCLAPIPQQFRARAEEFVGHMVQFDLLIESNRHMILEYTVRVRDHGDVLHELLLDAPVEELTPIAPVQYPAAVAAIQ